MPLLPIDVIYQLVVTGSSIWGAKMDCQQDAEALTETDHLQHWCLFITTVKRSYGTVTWIVPLRKDIYNYYYFFFLLIHNV